MSASPARWVVVDDADSSIHYTGPWFVASSNDLDSLGNFGPTYLRTSHGTNGTASFDYSFQGSAVNVFGTTNINNSSGTIDPTWECFIDGVSIGSTSPFQYAENNWLLCTWNDNGPAGSHVLTVNAKSTGHNFWFDWLQYEPPQSASVQNAVVYLDHMDAAIKFDSSWQSLGGSANMTTKEGSTVTLDFIGTQLSWYGFIPTELPHGPSLATYTVDGQTIPTSFTLKGLPSASATIYDQQFFQTPVLPYGPHELMVTFRGDGSSTPLTITYILVQDGSLSITAPSASSSSSSSSSALLHSTASSSSVSTKIMSSSTSLLSSASSSPSSSSPSFSSHIPLGAIIGGSVGALVLILGFIICFCKRRLSPSYKKAEVQPFYVPTPQHNVHFYSEASQKSATHTSQPSFQSYDPPIGFTRKQQMEARTSLTMRMQMPESSSVDAPARGLYIHGAGGSRCGAVLHQDSGVRLSRQVQRGMEVLVDFPPLYTPG